MFLRSHMYVCTLRLDYRRSVGTALRKQVQYCRTEIGSVNMLEALALLWQPRGWAPSVVLSEYLSCSRPSLRVVRLGVSLRYVGWVRYSVRRSASLVYWIWEGDGCEWLGRRARKCLCWCLLVRTKLLLRLAREIWGDAPPHIWRVRGTVLDCVGYVVVFIATRIRKGR